MFSAFTTRASGNAAWMRSASESVLLQMSVGGMPPEKSRGLATSTRILPAEVGGAGGAEGVEGVPALGRVDDHLSVGGGVGEAARRRLASPLALRRRELVRRGSDAAGAEVLGHATVSRELIVTL